MLVAEIRLGSIIGSHGIKGWFKVYSYTEPIESILSYSPWILRKADLEQRVVVSSGQLLGKKLIANVVGIDSRNLADELAGYEIHGAEVALPKLDEGDFYWFQLEGLAVVSEDGHCFGKVGHMMETGASDVMVVRPTDQSIDNQERLIPYIDREVVLKVDLETREILVDWQADY